jgi:hypothetical protein
MQLPPGTWVVGKADGSTEKLDPADTAGALASQNQLRTRLGLPAVPDPESIVQPTAPASSAPEPAPQDPGGG